ncbi:MAG: aldose epimerase [Nakamurella sp.]
MGRSATPRRATGEQYVLRRGNATAVIGQVAAVLRDFTVDGTHYTETWPTTEPTPQACGSVLMPWPNRVAGAAWSWQGEEQQLDVTEPSHGNASHGLLRYTAYQVTTLTADSVILSASVFPQHGWPFTLDTSVAYALTDAGLRVTHRVSNVGPGEAVFGCGAHPYLRIGDVPTEELTATVRAASYFVTNDVMIPIEKRPLDSDLAALPTGASLRDMHLDTGFGDLELIGEHIEHVLEAPDGRTLTIWADSDFKYTIVFTPVDFPNDTSGGPEGVHRAVAIEPMTCPTNALNSGEGLITLQPGAIWQASWGLTPGNR